MAATFAKKSAAMLLQMTYQINALHISVLGGESQPLADHLDAPKPLFRQGPV